jgi:hypothetical protein
MTIEITLDDGLDQHAKIFTKLRPFYRIAWSPGDVWYWRPNMPEGTGLGPMHISCRLPTFADYLERFAKEAHHDD